VDTKSKTPLKKVAAKAQTPVKKQGGNPATPVGKKQGKRAPNSAGAAVMVARSPAGPQTPRSAGRNRRRGNTVQVWFGFGFVIFGLGKLYNIRCS
jgi:hypothetical protein